MPIVKEDEWKEYQKANSDPYGKCIVDVARRVMEILDAEDAPLEAGDASKLINRADDEIRAGGITGFMAGAAAEMVSRMHSRGKEFAVSWNASYGIGNAALVVNPAIVTVYEPEEEDE